MVFYLSLRKVTKALTHCKVASGTLAIGKGSPIPVVHRGGMKGYWGPDRLHFPSYMTLNNFTPSWTPIPPSISEQLNTEGSCIAPTVWNPPSTTESPFCFQNVCPSIPWALGKIKGLLNLGVEIHSSWQQVEDKSLHCLAAYKVKIW